MSRKGVMGNCVARTITHGVMMIMIGSGADQITPTKVLSGGTKQETRCLGGEPHSVALM